VDYGGIYNQDSKNVENQRTRVYKFSLNKPNNYIGFTTITRLRRMSQ